MHRWDETIKVFAGEALAISLRMIGYTLFAVVLNVVLLIMQWELVFDLFSSSAPLNERWHSILVTSGIVLFPVLFFIIGQKQALQNCVSNILESKKQSVVLFLVNRICTKYPELLEPSGAIQLNVKKVSEYFTEVMSGLPSVITKILQFFVEKTGFYDIFVSSMAEYRDKQEQEPIESRAQLLSQIISNLIPSDTIKPDIKYPLIAFFCNVALFYL